MTERTEAQVRAARANGVLSKGPISDSGKSKSSTNRASHGLTGSALILPGESVGAYRQHQASWFGELAPMSTPEAQIVQQLGDAAWRLARCSRLEHQQQLATVETEMQKTEQWQSFSLVHRALTVMNVLVQHFEIASGMNPDSPRPTTEG